MRFATMDDRAEVERICNDPMIRLWTAFDGAPPCDATKHLTAPSFAVMLDGGCFLADCIEPRRYVIHTNLLPECRGDRAMEASRAALALAFLHTDAMELLTMVPATIPHAAMLARRMGFRQVFTRAAMWPCAGKMHNVGFYALTVDDWIASGACSEAGRWFHVELERQAHPPAHADDPVHDAFVGAAVEMIRASQPRKAVAIYNHWARFALYEPVKIISEAPLRLDIAQCVLRVEGDSFIVEARNA